MGAISGLSCIMYVMTHISQQQHTASQMSKFDSLWGHSDSGGHRRIGEDDGCQYNVDSEHVSDCCRRGHVRLILFARWDEIADDCDSDTN